MTSSRYFLRYPVETVVFAHGTPPSKELADALLTRATQVIVTDGALTDYLRLTDRLPEVVIGDGDSVSRELLERHGLTFIRIDEQLTNDLTKAVMYALGRGWQTITILGGTGRREDHTIGNIFLLEDYHEAGARVQMVSDYGTFVPFTGRLEAEIPLGREISLFSQDHRPMSAEGVAYPFDKDRGSTFDRMWQMTLNSVTEVPIRLETEGRALLYVACEDYIPRSEIEV